MLQEKLETENAFMAKIKILDGRRENSSLCALMSTRALFLKEQKKLSITLARKDGMQHQGQKLGFHIKYRLSDTSRIQEFPNSIVPYAN